MREKGVLWIFVIAAGLCLTAFGTAEAKVKVKKKTTYYSVQGKTGKALGTSMLKGGRKRIKLSHAIAATETEIEFGEPRVVIKGNKCIVKDIDVFLNIEYIYPKWLDKKRAPKKVRNRWNAFYRELKRHEEKHGAIALAGAKSLERELLKMNGNVAIGCVNFGSFAAFRLRNVVRKTALAQRNFDRREYSAASRISKLQKLLFEAK